MKMAQKVKIKLLDCRLLISDEILLGQTIEVKGKKSLVDQIVFEMPNFDMILGIDFSERHRAEIDYQYKKV